MKAISAGLLAYKLEDEEIKVLLVHPGGPYWAKKDDGAWSIPKGQVDEGEDLLSTANREFKEETGFVSSGEFKPLGSLKMKSGKVVHAWAFEGDFDPSKINSNSMEIEWPSKSGRRIRFPEVDRAAYFDLDTARVKLISAQSGFVDRLIEVLGSR